MSYLNSRLSGFYKLTPYQRRLLLSERGFLSESFSKKSIEFTINRADRIVENVIDVFELPLGVITNFQMNGKDHIVPIVIEEPSVIAAMSYAALTIRDSGGFYANHLGDTFGIGQIQLIGINKVQELIALVDSKAEEWKALLHEFKPSLLSYGTGVQSFSVVDYTQEVEEDHRMAVIYMVVDTGLAMGANLINTLCERLAKELVLYFPGKTLLKILSNYATESLIQSKVRIPFHLLNKDTSLGKEIAHKIVLANDFAKRDVHRAVTHNKGILNGIDGLAISTGNDWRAIEASLHAWASRTGVYQSLTDWKIYEDCLIGELLIPLKVGVIGGGMQFNPKVTANYDLLGNPNHLELSYLMASVGLGQNFAALRALVTEGIQNGHMRLHNRHLSTMEKETSITKLETLQSTILTTAESIGKVILTGEHAVVYGYEALAVPINQTIKAYLIRLDSVMTSIQIPDWRLSFEYDNTQKQTHFFGKLCRLFEKRLGIQLAHLGWYVEANIPLGMGLGASASLAYSLLKTLNQYFTLGLSIDEMNHLVLEAEKITHGTPSGIDNTVIVYQKPLVFYPSATKENQMRWIHCASDFELLFVYKKGLSGNTKKAIQLVSEAYQLSPERYQYLFESISNFTKIASNALQKDDFESIAHIMNANHTLLEMMNLVTPEMNQMIDIAKKLTPKAIKLTGSGLGGGILILDENLAKIREEMQFAGFQCMLLKLGVENE